MFVNSGALGTHRQRHLPFDVAAFWSRIDRSGGPEACWTWDRPHSTGYGQVWKDGRIQRAHRIAWELLVGPIPDGLDVCHDCPGRDNPACCNPLHLWLGTHAQNMADMAAKGRGSNAGVWGEAHGMSRLTNEQARQIRNRARAGEDQGRLAATFGVSKSTISMIKCGHIWTHLEEVPAWA